MLKANEHNFDRIRRAVEHDFEYELLEKPLVAVKDVDTSNTDPYQVNPESLLCGCLDFEHNCNEGEYCKHLWFLALKRSNML